MNKQDQAQATSDVHQNATFSRLLILIKWLAVLAFFLLMGILYFVFFPNKPGYYMMQPQNKAQLMPALDYPVVARTEIARWSSQAVISIYHFDFNNWETRMNENAHFFTSNGFKQFQNVFKERLISGVVEQKLQVTAVLSGPVVILAEGMIAGRYTWKVNLPVLLTFTSGNEVQQRKVYVTLVIIRVSTRDSPRGYAIEQFYEESA